MSSQVDAPPAEGLVGGADDPVATALSRLGGMYDDVVAEPGWRLSDRQLVSNLDAAYALVARAHTVALRLLAEVSDRDVASRAGAPSTAAWLRSRYRLRPQQAKHDVAVASLIGRADLTTTGSEPPQRLGDAVAAGLWRGSVGIDQARVIAHALDELPPDTTPRQQRQAEHVLVTEAAHHEPASLERLGHRIGEHIDPEAADVRIAERLEAEAREAQRRRSATRFSDGHGSVYYKLRVAAADDAHIWPVLDCLAAPTPSDDGLRDDRAPSQRLADAFVESFRRVSLDGGLPMSGGDRPRAVVTTGLEQLRDGIGHGTLVDTGEQLAPTALRRLCCDADLVPAVLNTAGVPLDVGRTARCFTGQLRLAVILRDLGCVHPGCDRPARWCDVHHVRPWWAGGETRLDNGVLLCGYHHTLYDHGPERAPRWRIGIAPDGIPETIPPAWIDPDQNPIRHHRFPVRSRPPPQVQHPRKLD